MVLQPIDAKLVKVALQECDTASFERFGQAFFGALIGRTFVPLGGTHDGGADGFVDPEIFEDQAASQFLQISKQESIEPKIRKTVARLVEVGRKPRSLVYFTSLVITMIDQLEDALSDELGVRVKIRDGKYIESQINHSDSTIIAFSTYLEPSISFLRLPGTAPIAGAVSKYADKTLAVFLRQEVEHRQGKTDLLQSVADSLILWSLAETDPEKGLFLDRDEILAHIERALPTARQFIRGVLDDRLLSLRTKAGGQDRAIRYYTDGNRYCLPFETRKIILQENVDDASIKIDVSERLKARFGALASSNEKPLEPLVTATCHATLERLFEIQGLQVAQFAHGGEEDDELYENAADLVSKVVDETIEEDLRNPIRRLSLAVLRGTFYDPSPDERTYLQKLSQTYVLLLLLKNEPKIVEYFQALSTKFVLYIGTDFLVRALSEHYLAPENQMTRNLFTILKAAGSTLVLTEKAVEELASHIRGQIFEFQNYYAPSESRIPLEMVQYIDRILIRAYFYSRLATIEGIKPPAGFRSYVEQFAPYDDIRNEQGDQALARYLVNKFGFAYETTDQMKRGLDETKVKGLAQKIVAVKRDGYHVLKEKAEILAHNDALQVYRVYERRAVEGENSPANPFSFQTWWLTQDASVRKASASVIAAHNGHRFMMRPEFVLNFVSFAPSKAEILSSYRTIFPTVLGVRLSNRVHSETFKEILKSANELRDVDDARSASIITGYINSLKGDTMKVYENKWASVI